MEGTIGEIRMFAGNFAPKGWAFCEGQLLSINEYQSLFSIVGNYYGGDGRTNFGLPDFRGRVSMGAGNGPGLTPREFSQKFGNETNVLQVSQLPPHNHDATINTVKEDGDKFKPKDTYLAADTSASIYSQSSPDAQLAPNSVTVGNTGGGQGVNNIQPTLVMNYIICTEGLYPQRN